MPESSEPLHGSLSTDSAHSPYPLRLYIQGAGSEVYQTDVLSTMLVRDLALDYVEMRNLPQYDQDGRPQRFVVDRADPERPERWQRLRGDLTLHAAGVQNNDTLRILQESRAGLFNPHERLRALVVDQRELQQLAAEDPQIEIKANTAHAATAYELTFHCPGLARADDGQIQRIDRHELSIVLPADYPVSAPQVRWRTPIFHPNVYQNKLSPQHGAVCLGELMDRYRPGLGLVYIVRMLRDMAQYHNYNITSPLNQDAARWAQSAEGQETIAAIGGVPCAVTDGIQVGQERHPRHQRATFTPGNPFDNTE